VIIIPKTFLIVIKFILPTIILFLIVLFWKKIADLVLKKFNIRLNYIIVSSVIVVIVIIIMLLNF